MKKQTKNNLFVLSLILIISFLVIFSSNNNVNSNAIHPDIQKNLLDDPDENYQYKPISTSIQEYDFFSNISLNEKFYRNDTIFIQYSFYVSNTSIYYYTLTSNENLISSSKINQSIYHINFQLDTKNLGKYNLNLTIYFSESEFMEDILTLPIIFQDIITYEIIAHSFLSSYNIMNNLSSIIWSFGLLTIVGTSFYFYFLPLLKKNTEEKILESLIKETGNTNIGMEYSILKKEDRIFNKKVSKHIMKFCSDIYPELSLDVKNLSDEDFWENQNKGGIKFR